MPYGPRPVYYTNIRIYRRGSGTPNMNVFISVGGYVLLSLDFGVGVFHDFSRMNFGGNELMQGRTLTPQQDREMQKGFDLSTGQLSR